MKQKVEEGNPVIIEAFKEYIEANKNVKKMLSQCQRFQPRYAVMLDMESAEQLASAIQAARINTEVLSGIESLEKVASLSEVDAVMAAIVGAAGIRPTFAAARTGKLVLLANKETLVMAGRIFMDLVKQHNATLLPIDSEHNAIYQSLPHHFNGNLAAAGGAATNMETCIDFIERKQTSCLYRKKRRQNSSRITTAMTAIPARRKYRSPS